VPALDEHLRSEDFFEVAKFPTAIFRSAKVEPGAGKDRLKVTGELNLHGVTRPVTLDVIVLKVGSNPRTDLPTVGFEATAILKRSDFGLGAYVPQVSDEIKLQLTSQGVEAKAYAEYLKKQADKK
jgi:polyisoprenoid-binding protein YceI